MKITNTAKMWSIVKSRRAMIAYRRWTTRCIQGYTNTVYKVERRRLECRCRAEPKGSGSAVQRKGWVVEAPDEGEGPSEMAQMRKPKLADRPDSIEACEVTLPLHLHAFSPVRAHSFGRFETRLCASRRSASRVTLLRGSLGAHVKLWP